MGIRDSGKATLRNIDETGKVLGVLAEMNGNFGKMGHESTTTTWLTNANSLSAKPANAKSNRLVSGYAAGKSVVMCVFYRDVDLMEWHVREIGRPSNGTNFVGKSRQSLSGGNVCPRDNCCV